MGPCGDCGVKMELSRPRMCGCACVRVHACACACVRDYALKTVNKYYQYLRCPPIVHVHELGAVYRPSYQLLGTPGFRALRRLGEPNMWKTESALRALLVLIVLGVAISFCMTNCWTNPTIRYQTRSGCNGIVQCATADFIRVRGVAGVCLSSGCGHAV